MKLKKSVTVLQIGSTGYRVTQALNCLDIDMNAMLSKKEVQKLIDKGVPVVIKAAK